MEGRGKWSTAVVAALAAALVACALWVAPAHSLLASGSPAHPRAADCHAGVPPVLHDGFPEPPAHYSHNGVLDARCAPRSARYRSTARA